MAASPKNTDFFALSQAAVADHELHRKLDSASARHLDHVAEARAEFPSYEPEPQEPEHAAWAIATLGGGGARREQ